MNELITVIIPAYNCETTIETAINSIRHQTYKNLQIIVVDDSSTDNTKSIVKQIMKIDPRIELYDSPNDPNRFDKTLNRNVNAGWSARNVGFQHTNGKYITFQDADDASLNNRIEIQVNLLKKHNAIHVTIDWFKFDEKFLDRNVDLNKFKNIDIVYPETLNKLSQKTKGTVSKISPWLNTIIPFHWKRKRFINKIFFGSLENYPGACGFPLFDAKIIKKVKFRPLKHRIWPSFMGRGADKDFNFQVAETFRNSFVFFIPLYMWRVKDENVRYLKNKDFLI